MSPEFDMPRHWRLKKERYRLIGKECPYCQAKIFPPRDICPDCGKKTEILYQFSGKGEIYSHTTVYEAPSGFEEQTPYVIALIKLEEGPLVTAQLTDPDPKKPIKIGDKVEMVIRKLKTDGNTGLIIYSYKFRPVP